MKIINLKYRPTELSQRVRVTRLDSCFFDLFLAVTLGSLLLGVVSQGPRHDAVGVNCKWPPTAEHEATVPWQWVKQCILCELPSVPDLTYINK